MMKPKPLVAALVALLALSACGEETKKKGGKPSGGGDMAMAPVMAAPTPKPKPPKEKEVVLPIPADLPALRFNVEKLRVTPWFKKHGEALRQELQERSTIAAALIACKLDPINDVEGATVGMSFAAGKSKDIVAILKIEKKAHAVLDCVKRHLAAEKLPAKKTTLAGRPAVATRYAERDVTVVALREDQLIVCTGALRARVEAVLTGKAPSIASTDLYKSVNKQVGEDTLFGGIVPGLPGALGKGMPPFLQKMKTGALVVNLPEGKSTMKLSLHFEDAEKAQSLTKKLPELLRIAGSRYPVAKEMSKGLKARADKSWAYLDFRLETSTFERLRELVRGMLATHKATKPK